MKSKTTPQWDGSFFEGSFDLSLPAFELHERVKVVVVRLRFALGEDGFCRQNKEVRVRVYDIRTARERARDALRDREGLLIGNASRFRDTAVQAKSSCRSQVQDERLVVVLNLPSSEVHDVLVRATVLKVAIQLVSLLSHGGKFMHPLQQLPVDILDLSPQYLHDTAFFRHFSPPYEGTVLSFLILRVTAKSAITPERIIISAVLIADLSKKMM